jgi:hypothetical protein
MRRLRLLSNEEQMLRETVRGMLIEGEHAPNDGPMETIGSAVAWARATPPVVDTLGRVFYPHTGFGTKNPFLVVARKSTAKSDETASAYLLMFEKPAWEVREEVGRLWYPPGAYIPLEQGEIRDILNQLEPGWEISPGLKRSVILPRTGICLLYTSDAADD